MPSGPTITVLPECAGRTRTTAKNQYEMQIKDKIVLLTGGANGLGFAYATELLRNEAAHVAILDLANANGEEAASKLNKEFGQRKAISIICDVTKPQELEAGFAKTVKEFGGLDIVINNAGIMDDSRWELMVQINFNAVARGTILGLKYMGKDGGGKGGTIVNISSIAGIIPLQPFPLYAGTKHAVIGLSRSFAQPYHNKKTGVRILILCPSVTETQLMTQCIGRTLDIVGPEAITNGIPIEDLPPLQTVENVARGMLHMLRTAENGSTWFIEAGKPIYEIEVPDQIIMKN